MTTDQTPDRLDGLRTEYANTGMVKYDGAVWLLGQVVVLRERLAAAVPVPPPADQTALRASVAEALLDHLSRTADIRPGRDGALAFMPEVTDAERLRIADAVLAVLPEPVDRAAVLEEAAQIAVADNQTCPAVYQCQPCLTRERVAAVLLRAAATTRRVAAEEQPAETQWPGERCMLCPPDTRTRRLEDHMVQVHGARPAALPAVGEQPETQEARHIGGRVNAEDCPACTGTNPPYPFLCPGPDAP